MEMLIFMFKCPISNNNFKKILPPLPLDARPLLVSNGPTPPPGVWRAGRAPRGARIRSYQAMHFGLKRKRRRRKNWIIESCFALRKQL